MLRAVGWASRLCSLCCDDTPMAGLAQARAAEGPSSLCPALPQLPLALPARLPFRPPSQAPRLSGVLPSPPSFPRALGLHPLPKYVTETFLVGLPAVGSVHPPGFDGGTQARGLILFT